MKAGVCTIALKAYSIEDALLMIKKAGASCVEVWGGEHSPMMYDTDECRKLSSLISDTSLEVVCFGSYYKVGEEIEMRDIILSAENQCEAAKAMGAPLIRIWAGACNYEDASSSYVDSVIESLRLFGDVASEKGIGVVLERHENTLTNSYEGVTKLFERIKHPTVSLNYQIPAPRTGKYYREKSVQDFASFLPISTHAHLQNYVGSENSNWQPRAFLEEGIIDYKEFGRVAKETSYNGAVMVEFLADKRNMEDDFTALKKDIDFIKTL